MNIIRIPATLFSAALLAFASAGAQTVVTSSATAPTENVLASFVATGADVAGMAWRADPSASSQQWRDLGEMFVVGQDSILSGITVVTTSGVNAPGRGASFTLTLYSFSSLQNVGSASTLLTLSGTTPSTTTPGGSFLTLGLPDLQVEAGAVYGFLLHFDTPEDGRSIPLKVQNNPGGIIVNSDGRLLNRVNTLDPESLGSLVATGQSLEFYVQGSAIPEPASTALFLGLGALAITRFRMRRLNVKPLAPGRKSSGT